jgi:hypothetical protein
VKLSHVPPSIIIYNNIKHCPLCYKHHGQNVIGSIPRGIASYCPKHYRIQSSRNRALSRGLYSPSLKELEAMIPADMKCRLCAITMIHTLREGTHCDIMTLQHWKGGTVEWICSRCNSSHGACEVSDETWTTHIKNLKENEKFCRMCKKVKDVNSFYKSKNGSKGRTTYCQVCHNEYTHDQYVKEKNNK